MTQECVFIDAVRTANARAHKTLCGGFGNANAVLVEKIAG